MKPFRELVSLSPGIEGSPQSPRSQPAGTDREKPSEPSSDEAPNPEVGLFRV